MITERLAGLPGDLMSYAALPKTVPGFLLFTAGMAVALLALKPFLKYRISPHPLSRTPHRLFTAGIYSLSRNPMYLSLLLMLAGLGLALSPWLLPVTLPLAFFFLRRQILREENFLKDSCPEYSDYLSAVPRWCGIRHG
ncbi:methyltransferase family protein [Succinimonas sp.]|uniref:methyltransferase family protein n=1 Tax=Succinimonas sp. TaxID=1936151 RepID=UPI00386AE829